MNFNNRHLREIFLFFRFFVDMSCVALSWLLAYGVRFESGWFDISKGNPPFKLYLKLTPFVVIIWSLVFFMHGFYRYNEKFRSAFMEALKIVQACIFATILFIAFTYFYEEYRYSRITLLIFFLIHPFLLIMARSFLRKIFRRYNEKLAPQHAAIVVSSDRLDELEKLFTSYFIGYKESGSIYVIGDMPQINPTEHSWAWQKAPDNWDTVLNKTPLNTILFVVNNQDTTYMNECLPTLIQHVADIKIIPDFAKYSRFSTAVDVVNGQAIIYLQDSPLQGLGSIAKRCVDIFGALIGFILFSPFFFIFPILIKLSSRGPIFYKQERIGMDGKTFHIIKFRSMPIDVEEKTGAVFARANDGRATLVGSIMRKLNLDEIPQFWNVFVGDMSLVGPRPERTIFVHEFRRHIPGYMLRHKVKAGLTGWAQVNGWRGDTSIEKRIEFDLFYIQNWSLKLDLQIMFMTILKLFNSKNAY